MTKPHKYAEAIKAWADGKPIQFKPNEGSSWTDYDPEYARQHRINLDFYSSNIPKFDEYEWRVKPKNIVFEELVYVSKTITEHGMKWSLEISNASPRDKANIRLEFSPDNYQLIKVEVIR